MKTDPDIADAIQRLRVRTVRYARTGVSGQKKLVAAIAKVNKDYGEGALSLLSDLRKGVRSVPCLSTGFGNVDDVINGTEVTDGGKQRTIAGTGIGLPKGRIIEIYGPESSGKTTLALHIIAAAQARGLVCAFIDAEHSIDLRYAAKLRCDTDAWLFSQPQSAEQGLSITEQLAGSGQVDLIVVDSVAALTPQAELDGEVGDQHMGLHARLMSQGLRKLTPLVSRNNVLLIFINQTRAKFVRFGNPETTTGGNALRFFASIRIRVSNMGRVKEGTREVGMRAKLKVVKNKVGEPFREVFLDIVKGRGIVATHRSKAIASGAAREEPDDDDD